MDEQRRALERAWRESPHDPDARAALVAALRRAGEPLPDALLAAPLQPARTFASRERLDVWVEHPDGRAERLGTTPEAGTLELPEHRAWWVHPHAAGGGDLPRLVAELEAQGVPGLALCEERLRREDLERLPASLELTWASLVGCELDEACLRALLERAPRLRALDLGRAAHALRPRALTELLRGRGLVTLGLEGVGTRHVAGAVEAGLPLSALRVGLAPLGGAPTLLAALPELRRLELEAARGLTARSLADLAALPLTHLAIGGTLGADWARWVVSALRRSAHLEALALHTAWPLGPDPRSHATLREGLAAFPALRGLVLQGHGFGPVERRALREALPACAVRFVDLLPDARDRGWPFRRWWLDGAERG